MLSNAATDAFFDYVRRIEKGFDDAVFSFVAIKNRHLRLVVQSNLVLEMDPARELLPIFESASIVAAQVKISSLGFRPRAFVERLIDGKLEIAGSPIILPPSQPMAHAATHVSFHPEGLKSQFRLDMLRFAGANLDLHLRQPALDWELRSASPPYDSVAELVGEYRVGPYRDEQSTFEVAATNVAGVDGGSSVSGTTANVILRLASALASSKVTLGYRVLKLGQVVSRGTVSGRRMKWSQVPDRPFVRQGVTELQVPDGAVVHCFANYDGLTQHHYWLTDPSTSDNPRRTVFFAFDPRGETLLDFLRKGPGKGNARDLESGVAWLAWILGFAPAHLGVTPRTQDAPDLLLATPEGHLAVVECTTGHLRTDNKLSLVLARAAEARRLLIESGQQHIRVIAVMVSSLSRDALTGDLDHAARLGVVVLSREDLETALSRESVRFPDADRFFRLAEQQLATSSRPGTSAPPEIPTS